MKAVSAMLAVALALALQTTLGRLTVGGTVSVDLVLVVVTYLALARGPMSAAYIRSAWPLPSESITRTRAGNE